MSKLVEVTEAAVALVKMQTQRGDIPTTEDCVVVETVKVAGYIMKNVAVATSAHNRSMTVNRHFSKVGLQAVHRTSPWDEIIQDG